MKRIIGKHILLLAAALLIISLSSCKPTETEIPPIPNISDDTTGNEPSVSLSTDDEIAYHRSLGMTIIESYDDKAFSSQYNLSTYDGLYALTVDSIYRTKLDIDILRASGYDDGTYDEFYSIITAFLKSNEPKCLLPRFQPSDTANKLQITWTSYITQMAELDESTLAGNKALISVYQYQCLCDSIGGADISKRLSAYPLLSAAVVGTPAAVHGQHFDETCRRTVIDISAENAERLIFRYGRGKIKPTDTDVCIIEPDEQLYVSAGYAGEISVAAQNECGLTGETVYYTVKSELSSIQAVKVNFASSRLERVVRAYLGKSESEAINMTELTEITDVYINGDTVVINREGLTIEQMNKSEPASNCDFAFSDIDYFPCLTSLTVKHNETGNPSGTVISGLEWLELSSCGISDISGLESCRIKTIWLNGNQITDASVFATAKAIDNIMLSDNPLTALKLPEKAITQINIQNTSISEVGFLNDVISLFSFNCRGTAIKDITPVCRLTSLQYLTLPAGIDYSAVSDMPLLRELTVGEEVVK